MLDILKGYIKWLLKWLIVFYFVVALIRELPIARDGTDPGEWGERSGMVLRTDAATGCQYLEAMSGGLTPRIGGDGQHMGCAH